MITMQTILNQLTGTEICDSLIHFMTEEFEDFAAARKQYEYTMESLQTELGEDAVTEAMDAVRQLTVSSILFSGALGIKANLDNFIDPLSRNFLDVEPEIYLRENTARSLPEYACARRVLNRFCASLTPGQQTLYEAVIAYISYLETAGPKLAHYCGYLLGNQLLPRIVPGYHTDAALTERYHMMLANYFGRKMIPESLGIR